ncbi:MAG: hypothetical protein AAF502_16190, partial [Bacteroidota bacterium]
DLLCDFIIKNPVLPSQREIVAKITQSYKRKKKVKLDGRDISSRYSEIRSMVNEFLIFRELNNDQLLKKRLYLKALADKFKGQTYDMDLLNLYEDSLNKVLKDFEKQRTFSSDFLWHKMAVLEKYYEVININQKRSSNKQDKEEILQKLHVIIDNHYRTSMSHWALESKIRNLEEGITVSSKALTFFHSYTDFFLKDLDTEIIDHSEAYMNAYLLFENLNNTDRFNKLREFVNGYIVKDESDKVLLNQISSVLANYLTFHYVREKQINRKKSLRSKLLSLYDQMIKGGFFSIGYIPVLKFKNYVTLCCHAGYFDKAHDFLKANLLKLNPLSWRSLDGFCKAAIAFYQNDLDDAERLLLEKDSTGIETIEERKNIVKADLDNIDIDIDRKFLMLKIYLLKSDKIKFNQESERFRKKLEYDRKNNHINPSKEKIYNAFCQFVIRYYFKYGIDKRVTKGFLIQKLNDTTSIVGKGFLMEKILELK